MPRRRLVLLLIIAAHATAQNQFDNLQKDRARQMLKDLADGIRKHYYDPAYHGVDLEAPTHSQRREPRPGIRCHRERTRPL